MVRRPIQPFVVVAVAGLIVTLALFALPESTVRRLEDTGPLHPEGSTVALSILAVVAVVQALYGATAVLRVERIQRDITSDPGLSGMDAPGAARMIGRNAAFLVFLTIVYGLASFVLTGQRGGYWLFVVVAIGQGAWYYRQTGVIVEWLSRQTAAPAQTRLEGAWSTEPADYCPPLARGLIRRRRT